MIVIVDANAILSDPHFKHSNWRLLAGAIADGVASVCVPSIALDEICHHYPSLREKIASDLERQSRHLQGAARALVDEAVKLTRSEAQAYSAALPQLLADFGFTIRSTPQVDHDHLARMALARQRPFDQGGSGYRDSLIWATVLELIEEEPDDDFLLISSDRGAFIGEHDDLHDDLREQAADFLSESGTIALSKTIGGVQIPGKYRGGPSTPAIHSDLAEFVVSEVNSGRSDLGELDPFDFRLEVDFIDAFEIGHLWIRDLVARELSASKETEIQFAGDAIGVFYTSDFTDVDGRATFEEGVAERKVRVRGVMFTEGRGTMMSRVEDLRVSLDEGADESLTPLDGLELFEGRANDAVGHS